VTLTGGLKCWGRNQYGQLGDGSMGTLGRPVPTDVLTLTSGVADVAAGALHTCALTTGGGVKCWGYNGTGQLGDNTTSAVGRSVPDYVANLISGVVAIAAGASHTCALTTAGAVKCWGWNYYGQLGDGTASLQALTPVQVSGMTTGAAAVSARGDFTCAKTTAGAVKCWGYNYSGELGDGTTTDKRAPVNVSGLTSGVLTIGAGAEHACALLTGGAVKCWGYNSYGAVGDGTTTNRSTPTAVNTLGGGVAALSVGANHACVQMTGGAVSCWGHNIYGQVGDGTKVNRAAPTTVPGLPSGIASVSAGTGATCALTSSGNGLCWGSTAHGILADGILQQSTWPVSVYGYGAGLNVVAISPSTGPAAGATPVMITGSYILPGVTVTIGGSAAANVTVVNRFEIAAVTAAHAAGTVDVMARNPDATSATLPDGFTYADGGGPPTFTDDPLAARATPVKAVHVTELRQRVNELRVRRSLSAYSWTNATLTPGTTPVSAVDVAELRAALAEAYTAAGRTSPTYTDPTLVPGATVIGAVHIAELRAAVLALW
jgi:alpha-tubulin suppressor-like RCC1 family protein